MIISMLQRPMKRNGIAPGRVQHVANGLLSRDGVERAWRILA
jgi:hypothetical protein